jgi:hypothetical protein
MKKLLDISMAIAVMTLAFMPLGTQAADFD